MTSHPWFERISRLSIEGTKKVRIAVKMFIGRKDAAFGDRLRSVFPQDILRQYWQEDMTEYHMNANGFAWRMKEYLSMGFDVGELCEIVNFTDEEGNDLHEQFIGMLINSRLHWKEKDCSDWMVQDPEDPALESIESLLIRALAFGCRNMKVDRYIPIEEIKQILRDKLGAECETDALVDAFLLQEEELEKADVKERLEKDKSWEVNRIMNNAHDDMKKMYEEYDIPLEHMLPFYAPGNTIASKTVRLLQKVLAFGDTLLESAQYKELAVTSIMRRGTWLVSASDHLYGDLKDTDWELIFSNLEKDPDCFSRYYSLFCIELSNWSVRNAVIALVVNDDLYAYIRSLPHDQASTVI